MLATTDPDDEILQLIQGGDLTIALSIEDTAGDPEDFSSGYTADFNLYEKPGEADLDNLTSAGSRINLLNGSGDGTNVELLWDSTQSAAILSDSLRTPDPILQGRLRIFSGGLPVITKRLFFRLIQAQ